jgi:hypothetical protein
VTAALLLATTNVQPFAGLGPASVPAHCTAAPPDGLDGVQVKPTTTGYAITVSGAERLAPAYAAVMVAVAVGGAFVVEMPNV